MIHETCMYHPENNTSKKVALCLLQGDSTQRHVKNLDVVLGADTAVLILDDTEGVWPAHTANLIQVDRYIFFPACVTRFERSHKSLLELDKDEDAQKGMLKKALKILRRVHKGVFQVNPACISTLGCTCCSIGRLWM